MIEISAQQAVAIALEPVVTTIVEECERLLPRHCAALGPRGVREAVVDGIAAAQEQGIDFEDGWRAFVRLMFLFDRGFEHRLEWAKQAISAAEGLDATGRINALVVAARVHVQQRLRARRG